VTAEPVKSEETGAFKAEDGKFVDVADLLKVGRREERLAGKLQTEFACFTNSNSNRVEMYTE
jgi:hypothetical protein